MGKVVAFFYGSFCEFLNGPFIPLTAVVVGIVLFFVIYYKENKRINKYREDVQRKIIEEYHNGEENNKD